MAARKVFHCVADDTILITNVSEIKKWVLNGSITLILPIYTLERLAFLQKDGSQIGLNARKTVEFLDGLTEGKDNLPGQAVSLQGPTEQYEKWAEVEMHRLPLDDHAEMEAGRSELPTESDDTLREDEVKDPEPLSNTTNALSKMLLSKLNFANELHVTPPTSPGSSEGHSAKTSPEVVDAKRAADAATVPTSLQPLVNAVVWRSCHSEVGKSPSELYFISNSAHVAAVMRNFGVSTKNIHQLRQAVGLEDQEARNHSKYLQKHPSPPSHSVKAVPTEPRGMFKYEEDSDEELVFQPRGRGTRSHNASSAASSPKMVAPSPEPRSTSAQRCFRRPFAGNPGRPSKPEIPTEEIDPNSFDRGSFKRPFSAASPSTGTELADGVNTRGHAARGKSIPSRHARSGYRGLARGTDRGSLRGRGRLFVP